MSIISAILLFGFLIFVHEMGHFLLAKLSGVKVLRFSLGFGPTVFGKQLGETEYVISAVPLGGYVKMLGQEDIGEVADDGEAAEKERSFRYKPAYKRVLIILAGPLFNLLTAAVIFFFVFLAGVPILSPTIGEVMPDTPAAKALLQKGDKIVAINGSPVKEWAEMTDIIQGSPGKPLALTVRRKNALLPISITPESKKVKDMFGEERKVGLIGVKPSGETFTVKETIPGAVKNAFIKTWDISYVTVVSIIKLIQRIVPADTIGGPILIFQLAEKQAAAGYLSFFFFAAVISINLGILNLLPIPVLDGGHILFVGLEAIRKKPISEQTLLIAQRIGLALLLMLMIFAMYNDIFRIISGKPLP
ncbi:MAG TPA: RIP metalloprotease RseP [Dissulfurispiraceae bacterium]|nr:RIP metalloprotease RseP [Dissulfurispiraceae bacterium]